MTWKDEYNEKMVSAHDAAMLVKDGDRVYIGTCTSVAYELARALGAREGDLSDVTILSSNATKPLKVMDPESKSFRSETYFMGPLERKAATSGRSDFTSFHLSQTNEWVKHVGRPDVAFIEVSRPNRNGEMCFGASGMVADPFVLEEAKTVVLQVNAKVPFMIGVGNTVRIDQADAIVEVDEPLLEVPDLPASEELQTISDFLLEQVHDGDCLQLGIGSLASAVGFGLKERNDLGIHSEMIGNSLMALIKNGNVTNARKRFWKGKTAAGFAMGVQELYDFLDGNEDVVFGDSSVINNPMVIAQNDHVVSINSALAVDLTGQVVADNIAGRQYSAVGGQLDFIRGAQMSRGGRSFIAIPSSFLKDGMRRSHITAQFKPGTQITTPRADVEYVVTEFGCVNLKYLGMKERVHAMIELAHPEFRDELRDEAKAIFSWI